MVKKILVGIGFFLLELGANILIQLVFGKQSRKELEKLVKDLSFDNDLTAKQKYNRAKKFLDGVKDDAPDVIKNLAIEAVVSKVTDKADRGLKNVK